MRNANGCFDIFPPPSLCSYPALKFTVSEHKLLESRSLSPPVFCCVPGACKAPAV